MILSALIKNRAFLTTELWRKEQDILQLREIVKETENMSGAYLKEIVMVAYMITVEYGIDFINQKILDEAFESVKQLKREVDKTYGVKRMSDRAETLYN